MYNLHEAYLSIYSHKDEDIIKEDLRILHSFPEEKMVEIMYDQIEELLEDYTIEEIETFLFNLYLNEESTTNEQLILEVIQKLKKALGSAIGKAKYQAVDKHLVKYAKKHKVDNTPGYSPRAKATSGRAEVRRKFRKDVVDHMASKATEKAKEKLSKVGQSAKNTKDQVSQAVSDAKYKHVDSKVVKYAKDKKVGGLNPRQTMHVPDVKKDTSTSKKNRRELRGKVIAHKVKSMMSDYDYNQVVGHLIQEGYVNSVVEAENMINYMSQDWLETILYS